jgi:hypothetical protein
VDMMRTSPDSRHGRCSSIGLSQLRECFEKAGSDDTRNTPKVAMLPFASCSNLVNSARGVDVSLCRSNDYRCGSYRMKCHTMRRRPLAIAAHYHWTQPTGQSMLIRGAADVFLQFCRVKEGRLILSLEWEVR